ncbi:hypothetical protein LWI28_023914 [Acer negundo]|uniref:Uncharacterized protein n=1 Tax=Acer negundo TaxID=4023 RepID=A0AAD5IH34_ACENE|nr:hypothetical protein LWI28_023914 [Acer negundo]
MELEDTHMDAYLHILRKRQRYYSTVYGPRINIQDSQFYSWLLNDWERLMGTLEEAPTRKWICPPSAAATTSASLTSNDVDVSVARGG